MISSFDKVGLKLETTKQKGVNPMKRFLLICTAATAIMLSACIYVDVDRPALDGGAGSDASGQARPDKPAGAPEARPDEPRSADSASTGSALRNDAPRPR